MTIFQSDRRFQAWDWTVSHSALILRSNPTPETPTRIELLIKPAYIVCVAANLEGINITHVLGDTPAHVTAAIGRALHDWENLYLIESGTFHGWVIGGSISGREDDNGYNAPTMFDGRSARPGVRDLFTTYEHPA